MLLCADGVDFSSRGLDVGEVVVELAEVVVPLTVHSWKDAAAGQLWQILDGERWSLNQQISQNAGFRSVQKAALPLEEGVCEVSVSACWRSGPALVRCSRFFLSDCQSKSVGGAARRSVAQTGPSSDNPEPSETPIVIFYNRVNLQTGTEMSQDRYVSQMTYLPSWHSELDVRDLDISVPKVPAIRGEKNCFLTPSLALNTTCRRTELTISGGSGMETPQKNWLLLKTCWCRGIRSPAVDKKKMAKHVQILWISLGFRLLFTQEAGGEVYYHPVLGISW